MRLLLTTALFAAACTSPTETGTRRTRSQNPSPAPTACDNAEACRLITTKYNLTQYAITAHGSETFDVDGTKYSVVFYRFDDKDQSEYASIVVDGAEYPLDGTLPYDSGVAAPDYYCDEYWDDCYYTGYDLEVVWDDYFIDWVYDTDAFFTWEMYDYYDYYWDEYYYY